MNKKNNFDIIVIGGGVSGMLSAISLASSGMSVALIEKTKFATSDKDSDGRAISIAPGSIDILERFGIWQKLSQYAEKINHIRVLDNYSSFFLDFENGFDIISEKGNYVPL